MSPDSNSQIMVGKKPYSDWEIKEVFAEVFALGIRIT